LELISATRDQLLAASRKAALSAYCPYSHFHVGAALLADGKLFTGCNIENASYGLTVCAERVAIFNALASGCREFTALAVSCPDAPEGSPAEYRMPCGACRQVMAEFAGSQFLVLIDKVGAFALGELFPHAFRLK
jgi:cytidine deaminase